MLRVASVEADRPRARQTAGERRGELFDRIAVGAALVLLTLGTLNLAVVAGWPGVQRQLVPIVIGMALLAVFRRMRVATLPALGWVSYALAVLLLTAVQLVGLEANGARRWLAVGGFTLQPSELAKLGLLLLAAGVLAGSLPSWLRALLVGALAAVPIVLTLLEPDLSTAGLLVLLTLVLLVLGRIPFRLLLAPLVTAALLAPLALTWLRPYQRERLEAFLSDSPDAAGAGWNLQQAHIALASGGMFGLSREPLHDMFASYLPSRQTDLALVSLAEQWGLAAAALALAATVVLVWRLALASRRARTRQASLVAAGLACFIGIESVVCAAGNLGLLPLAGVPYPLLSYGGTASAVHLAALGIVLGARRDGSRRRLWIPSGVPRPRPHLARLSAGALTMLLFGCGAYGWHLQDSRGAELRQAAYDQATRCIRLPAPRGVITDRHSVVLAVDAAEAHVVAVPALLRRRPAQVARLAALTGLSPGRLDALLRTTSLSVRIAVLPRAAADRVATARITGVTVLRSPRRVYPFRAMLGPLLGFVGVATPVEMRRWPGTPLGEFVGRAGLEQQYDPLLRGIDGAQCVYVDARNRPVAMAERVEPVPGASVRLTLDMSLQRLLTRSLKDALCRHGDEPAGDLGGAVVLDPRNGQVLAMASVPSYDNNVFGPPVDSKALARLARQRGSPMLEHVTQVVAPPGSAFKLVVAAADVVHRAIPPRKVIPTGGSYTLGGHVFGNWRSFGPQNLMDAIAFSNDVYFYKLARALGADRIYQVGSELGVGRESGIDLPGESAGYFGNPAKLGRAWYPGSTVILGIGQGYITTTPIQVSGWTVAVSTGRVVTPHLGHAFRRPDGGYTLLEPPPPVALPFASKLGPVREGMRRAATIGTAGRLGDLPVVAGAKTGTAQDPASPSGGDTAWFTAVAPFDKPVVAVTVLVRGGGHGSSTAGPVAHDVLEYFLSHARHILAIS